jgi:steroid delta-isomerase-like uncharacterized protein
MDVSDSAAFARRLYETFNRGDLDGAAAMATEDVTVGLVPGPVFHGREGFLAFMGTYRRAFPDLAIHVENQVATADQVVNECSWTGTHTGPLLSPEGEIPATGRRVENGRFCEVWQMRDGRLASLRNYGDPTSWMGELGLLG